jgi:hypothetical protein
MYRLLWLLVLPLARHVDTPDTRDSVLGFRLADPLAAETAR